MFKLASALIAVLALSGCALMVAPTPLFTPADQPAEPPFAAGTWALLQDGCNPRRTRGDQACDRLRLTRSEDGAWLMQDPSGKEPERYRVVLVDAIAGGAVLLGEAVGGKTAEAAYAAIVPRGEARPARRAWLVLIGCDVATAGPPLAGLTLNESDGRVQSCTVLDKETALEAARRAVLLSAGSIGDDEAVWISE